MKAARGTAGAYLMSKSSPSTAAASLSVVHLFRRASLDEVRGGMCADVCRSTRLAIDVPFATLVQASNARLLAAQRRRLESRDLLRGQMPYYQLLRNAFRFEEAPKTDEGQNPNHCAGTRASWRLVESCCDQTPAARCILDKVRGDIPRNIIDKLATRCIQNMPTSTTTLLVWHGRS